jgi:hypothetical protein
MAKHPRDKTGRDKIRAGKILKRLQDHSMGKITMKSTEIKAAQILLAKVMPDLKAQEITGDINSKVTTVTVNRMAHTPIAGQSVEDQDTTTIN